MAIHRPLKKIKNSLGKVIAKVDGTQDKKYGGFPFKTNNLPWSDQNKDAFFKRVDLNPDNATKLFPYRLLVIDIKTGKEASTKQAIDPVSFVKSRSDTGGVHFKLSRAANTWEFMLPITPQQLSITDQFAINTTATMRGIVEEHNGVKFKMITASGTTGVSGFISL